MEDSKKKPTKKTPQFAVTSENIFGANRLDVPQCYKDEAAERGWETRWVSAKKLKENHGFHERGWQVYKFKSKPGDGILDNSEFAFGTDAEGVVRRGDCVLAVRPIELGNAHRRELEKKRKRYNNFGAEKKQEYKDFVKQTMGKNASAFEGYDD